MRALLWTTVFFLPALCPAQVQLSNTPANPVPAARVMSIEPTQTVDFDGSLAQLRRRLQLTDAQQAAWTRYADSVDAYGKKFFEENPLSAYAAEAAPRQVELLAQRLQDRLAAMREIARRAQGLYTLLSAQQQKTADQHLMASIPSFGNAPRAP